MNAAFFSRTPQVAAHRPAGGSRRARRVHRLVAIVFTLTVAANFAAMLWGPPPAWITFAPLPPLLFLMITGIAMLARPWMASVRGRNSGVLADD